MLNPKRASDRSKHRRGLVRVFGFAAVVGLAMLGVRVGAVRAEVGNQNLVIGRQMVQLANSAKNEIHRVTMNGQPMFFASQSSSEPPEKILARYEQHCRENAAQSPAEWQDVAAKATAAGIANGEGGSQTGAVFRSGDGDEGAVSCFVRSSSSKMTVAEALVAFDKTGDLGAIGQLRYAYVKKSRTGGTHVLAAWTTDAFNMDEIFPPAGKDAIGHDFSELPRPQDSVRTFSVHLDDAPYGVNMYESTGQSPDAVAKSYDDLLTKRGWYALDVEGPAKRAAENMKGVTARMYTKEGVMMTVVAHVERGHTVTGLAVGGVPASVAESDSKR